MLPNIITTLKMIQLKCWLLSDNSKLIQSCFDQWKQTRIDFRKREINLVNAQKLREQEMLKYIDILKHDVNI